MEGHLKLRERASSKIFFFVIFRRVSYPRGVALACSLGTYFLINIVYFL